MRRAGLGLPVVVVLAVGLWWRLGLRPDWVGTGREGGPPPAAALVSSEVDLAAVRVDAGAIPASPGRQTAFRLLLDGDSVQLMAVEELQGDFHRRRGRLAWLPGMLYCRLLDAEQRVLAEDTLAAPDRACVVLDPQAAGADGRPVVTMFSPSGPVVFQVRLPHLEAATELRVSRLTGPRPAGALAEPVGKLLASIALPQ
ncbi:MAG: hypothetical protein NTW21_03690 [Verrucomicrobia bacterium]|nr:hypothetical protein [Verrucomicrobiota bacterium]